MAVIFDFICKKYNHNQLQTKYITIDIKYGDPSKEAGGANPEPGNFMEKEKLMEKLQLLPLLPRQHRGRHPYLNSSGKSFRCYLTYSIGKSLVYRKIHYLHLKFLFT